MEAREGQLYELPAWGPIDVVWLGRGVGAGSLKNPRRCVSPPSDAHCGVVWRIPDLGRRYGEQVASVRLEAVGEPVKHHGAFQVGQPFRQDAEVALAVKLGSIGPE